MKLTGYSVLLLVTFFLVSCNKKETKIITVTGKISAYEIGKTLHHEHLLVDFIGSDSIEYDRWEKNKVLNKVLPYLKEIKNLGYKTLVDATPAYLGRDPQLLKMISDASGIQILTNTGLYTAINEKYLPDYVYTETAEQLAARWIEEAKNGIEGTGIFPGFIKIAVERKPLEDIQRKIVEAACITHKATGLIIMSHTGLAVTAFQQLEILEKYGVDPSAFIWTHANNEKDNTKHLTAAKKGVWIAFDKFTPDQLDEFVNFAILMKKEGLIDRLLFSHDAGWYDPAKPEGGDFRGYTDIENFLIPALEKNGLAQQEIYHIFTLNPAEAFKIKVRNTLAVQ